MGQSWSIIIFSYNEKGNVEQVLKDVASFCATFFNNIDFEVIVVDDGSNDGSEKFIEKIAQEHNTFKLVRHSNNLGIGQALKSGYASASFENICAIPADGQFDINELTPFLNFDKKNYISFYRPVKAGYSNFRKLLSFSNRFLNILFLNLNIKDVNWVKIYKSEQLSLINLNLNSSLIESEICCKLGILGYQPIEVPSKYLNRDHGNSKGGSFSTISTAVLELFSLVTESVKFRRKRKINQ